MVSTNYLKITLVGSICTIFSILIYCEQKDSKLLTEQNNNRQGDIDTNNIAHELCKKLKYVDKDDIKKNYTLVANNIYKNFVRRDIEPTSCGVVSTAMLNIIPTLLGKNIDL